MIHLAVITKYVVRTIKKLKLVRDHILSFSPFPTSVMQVEGVPAPFERSLTHPYFWDRDERDRSSRQRQPAASRSRDLPSAGMKQVERRQSERLSRRQPEHETTRRAARSRSR
jgi:hypothetical protein